MSKITKETQLVRDLFGTPKGEELLRLWVKRHCLHRTYVSGDVHATMINEGMRNFLIKILRQLNRSDALLLSLIEEGIKEGLEYHE